MMRPDLASVTYRGHAQPCGSSHRSPPTSCGCAHEAQITECISSHPGQFLASLPPGCRQQQSSAGTLLRCDTAIECITKSQHSVVDAVGAQTHPQASCSTLRSREIAGQRQGRMHRAAKTDQAIAHLLRGSKRRISSVSRWKIVRAQIPLASMPSRHESPQAGSGKSRRAGGVNVATASAR